MSRTSRVLLAVVFAAAAAAAQDAPHHVHTSREGARVLPLPREDGAWHFAIFGDRTAGPPEGVKVLAQAVEDANLLDPDLVMTVGDLIRGYGERERWIAEAREYREIMDRLRRPWFPVAGNHDIYWRGPEVPAGHHESDFERHFGPLWYWFRHKTAAFIVLYSDEGDAATGDKGFGSPRFDSMSDTQLAWLEKSLEETKSLKHVFVFLHHPRWITEVYAKTNWDAVHALLVKAGNVKAVFAGHIHRMRYDGKRDGIEYFTVGATGASYKAEVPRAGWLHHFHVVTVRDEGISVAALPVGAVIDPRQMTPERLADIDLLLAAPVAIATQPFEIGTDGKAEGACVVRFENPSSKPLWITVSPRGGDGRIHWSPDHDHFVVDAKGAHELSLRYRRDAGPLDDALRSLSLGVERDYLGDGTRVTLPAVDWPLPMRLAGDAPRIEGEGHLELDGKTACLSVPAKAIDLPDGPFTAEGWVSARSLKGRRPFLSKAQDSEWCLFLSDGLPEWSVHLDGRYVDAKAGERISENAWHHVAGVFDGRELRLYVDGRRVAATSASGHRTTNALSLYVGADPDSSGAPVDPLAGAIDEVRVSLGARYEGESFEPQRRFEPDPATRLLLKLDGTVGPWCPDASPSRAHALRIGPALCVPSRVAND